MRERKRREGHTWGGDGASGAQAKAGWSWARSGQAGPGWVASRVKIPRHAQPLIGIQTRNKISNETRRTRN
jgi:hypothetical protein